jgi:hypothetical protein
MARFSILQRPAACHMPPMVNVIGTLVIVCGAMVNARRDRRISARQLEEVY